MAKSPAEDLETLLHAKLAAYEEALRAEVKGIQAAGLSFGWEAAWGAGVRAAFSKGDVATSIVAVLTKLGGILLTAAALTLGAPFWFDMLKKLAKIGSVGRSLVEQVPKQ